MNALNTTAASDLLGAMYRAPDGAMTCALCNCEMEWVECGSGCNDGYFDGYDEDPMWYDQGDLVPCRSCGGTGGSWWCNTKECKTGTGCKTIEGTELYIKTLATDYGDAERNELMKTEWSPTPWMIDVHVGERREEIRHWCYQNLGRESSPMHGDERSWKQASVTLHGRSWFGFRSKALMERFQQMFPAPKVEIPDLSLVTSSPTK